MHPKMMSITKNAQKPSDEAPRQYSSSDSTMMIFIVTFESKVKLFATPVSEFITI